MSKKYYNKDINPDEIFLDSRNKPNFDEQQFEGYIEKPISLRVINIFSFFCFSILLLLVFETFNLQIVKGQEYFKKSEENKLHRSPIIAERGVIYDRNGIELAWNSEYQSDKDINKRTYIKEPGLAHVLGYVNYPKKDKSGIFWRTEYIGRAGAELVFNKNLSGQNGQKYYEIDAKGEIVSSGGISNPKAGENIYLSIDQKLTSIFYKKIEEIANSADYRGGAGVVMDINSGELLALTSFPEYDSEVLSLGEDLKKIGEYSKDKNKPYLNRALSGRYTPGSIVKPFFALGALQENIISPEKIIVSTGSISIPNPYFPDQKSVFYDWKAHGPVDMREAIAVSSDVYFYVIGGGFQNQKGIGISKIDKYAKMFGIGELTGVDLPEEIQGVIPTPEWKKKIFNDIWRVGDTYNTVIGQYGFLATPIQMTRAVGALANKGNLLTPTIQKNKETSIVKTDYFSDENYDVIFEGMRKTITEGTAQILNVPYLKIAGKTGTAQIGISKSRINSWIVGFFPYDKPKYSFALLMENGPSKSTVSASFVFRQILDELSSEYPEFLESLQKP